MREHGKLKMRAVIYEEGGVWVAQGLEHDIAAFSERLSELPRKFQRAVAAEVIVNTSLGRLGLDGVPPAPERFATLYEAAKLEVSPIAKGELNAHLRLAEAA